VLGSRRETFVLKRIEGMYVLHSSSADLLRCRFALSPLWELTSAVRIMHQPAGRRWHLPWLAAVDGADPPEGLGLLQAMQPSRGFNPDFLSPPPTAPSTTLEDEVERVARTPLGRLAGELARCRADQTSAVAHAVLDSLLGDPAQARERIVAALLTCWEALLAVHWPRVQSLLDADIAHHARQLADHGLIAVLTELHPDIRWQADAVQVGWQRRAVEQARELGGAGIVLMPSAFTWPEPIAILDAPWQPTIVYPARGVGVLWQQLPGASPALGAVVGPTRARLLADLAEPASTTWLAERYEMAASTISRHLILLQAAGLVRASRDGHQVLYQRTALGTALAGGGTGSP
jgi:hypothetical protein